ncbi:MAG: DUF924 domain-containing protein [Spirulinaceae cyanobacterium SM2_1_0]|nr:DUF924 domain-containing protein [Spirulinaceae cyanobacterium SM2_1_0]
MTAWQTLLDFWFDPPTAPDYGKPRAVWFRPRADFDAAIRDRFLPLYQQAAASQLEHWQAEPLPCLALLLLLDQVPRNLFREQPQAYATDAQALAIAKHALTRGFDQSLPPVWRWFVYLPLEHSEDLADQARSLALFQALVGEPGCDRAAQSAQEHYDLIARFGRFPHRNAILGRPNTSAEAAFLQQA